MGNLSKTMLIDISVKIGIVENIKIGVNCNPEEIASSTCLHEEFHDEFILSREEMPKFNLSFVAHEIKLYDEARQIKCQIPSPEIAV